MYNAKEIKVGDKVKWVGWDGPFLDEDGNPGRNIETGSILTIKKVSLGYARNTPFSNGFIPVVWFEEFEGDEWDDGFYFEGEFVPVTEDGD